jgi:ferredoxin-NADP reductase
MAMLRARSADAPPFRLLYSARGPDDVIYRQELDRFAGEGGSGTGLDIAYAFTRVALEGAARPAGRVRPEDLSLPGWQPADGPTCYVCGPTGFVEAVATILERAGHDPALIRTERFGPSGS